MPAADAPGPEDTPVFRSPKRTLARAFRLSRDRWKKKATVRREQLKALHIRIRDLEVSRALWKEKALHLQRQLDERLDREAALPQQQAQDAAGPSGAEQLAAAAPAPGALQPAALSAPDSVPLPEQRRHTPAAAAAAPAAAPAAAVTDTPGLKKKPPPQRR
jgi:hypothetical protein